MNTGQLGTATVRKQEDEKQYLLYSTVNLELWKFFFFFSGTTSHEATENRRIVCTLW